MIDLQRMARAIEKLGDAPVAIVPTVLLQEAMAEIALCRAGRAQRLLPAGQTPA